MTVDGAESRLHTLDAMRGFAAIVVMFWHTTETKPLIGNGYLAVDFFFALSGLVLAKAYETKLGGGLGRLRFIELRLLRLYPMYFLGMLIGIAAIMAKALGSHGPPAVPIAPAIAYGVFMLPAFGLNTLFPLNSPSWSLFLEVLINIIFCLLLVRLGKRTLAAICLISGALMAYFAVTTGSADFGFSWATFPLGFVRVTFGFTLGMLIWRLDLARHSRRSWLIVVPIAALVALLVAPVPDAWRGIYAAIFVLIATPILVVMGAIWQTPAAARPVANVFGDLSYPLYAIHRPTLFFAAIPRALNIPSLIWGPVMMGGLVVFAWLLGRYIDPYIRGQIQARMFWRKRLTPKPA
jgi:peptidoglycan/LPS O-acetylase OafA/YrhL